MTTDVQASGYAKEALRQTYLSEPTVGEVVCLQACSLGESGYGDYWKGAGVGSNNQGAIQKGAGWTGATFEYVDTHPIPGTNQSQTYRTEFRKYPTPVDGWEDLVRIMYKNRPTVHAAAISSDWYGVSREMYRTHYYEGFGPDDASRIAHHDVMMRRGINRALVALNQTPVIVPPKPVIDIPPTIQFGSVGLAVVLAQRELQLVADGIFGAVTRGRTQQYQSLHGLAADGKIGPATWTALLTDDFVPVAA